MLEKRFCINPILKNAKIKKIRVYDSGNNHYFAAVILVVNGKKATFKFDVNIVNESASYAFSDEEWERLCNFCISNRG